jgi:hypothetical protein
MKKITQDIIKNELNYNPETGIFTRRITRSNRAMAGSIAGTMRKNSGYIIIGINNVQYYAHRLAYIYVYGDQDSDFQIDHINHNRRDNRICNLRLSDFLQNSKNRPISKANKTGIIGAHFCKKTKKYEATITVNKKRIYLGGFLNLEDAAKARKKAEQNYGFHENHGVGKGISKVKKIKKIFL